MKLMNVVKSEAEAFIGNTKAVTYICLLLVLVAAIGTANAATLNATAVDNEAKSITEFIIALLNGWVGYLLALVAFFAGIFNYFKNRDLWGTMGAFGLAVMIMVVPPVLKGFFAGAA